MNVLERGVTYVKEMGHCWRRGASLSDVWTLIAGTIRFHAKLTSTAPTDVRIRLGPLVVPIRLRNEGGDWFIFHEVLLHEPYAIPDAWRPAREPRTIVDLGGNIGMTALYFASRFPTACIVAVEPSPETAAILRYNLQTLGSRATVVEAAVAPETGTVQLYRDPYHYNASLVREANANAIDVPAITLAGLAEAYGLQAIDILKMDIEGAEKLVLPARPAVLERVDLLLAELHDGYTAADLGRDLAFAGLTVHRPDGTVAAWRDRTPAGTDERPPRNMS